MRYILYLIQALITNFAALDMGTPTRQRKQLDLLVFTQPRYQENTEVDNKMKEIMKMNGILNINGKVRIKRNTLRRMKFTAKTLYCHCRIDRSLCVS